MKKILLLLLVFVLAGCTENNKDNDVNKIEIKHPLGVANVIEDIKKVAIFDLGVLDIFDNLNIEVEYALPVSSIPIYLSKYKNATDIGTLKEASLEKVYEFRPDVIFISERLSASYDDLNEIAPTIFVELRSDKFFEDLESNVGLIGRLFKKEQAGTVVLEEIKNLINQTKEVTRNLTDKALIVMYNDSLSVFASGSRFGIIHDVLGVKEADGSIDVTTHGLSVNHEYIMSLDPDVIFVIDRTVVVEGASGTNVFADSVYENIKAVKNNRVYYLDAVAWYTVSGGISSTKLMISEIKDSFK
jgi:iron complex transport system substrate-binding protein